MLNRLVQTAFPAGDLSQLALGLFIEPVNRKRRFVLGNGFLLLLGIRRGMQHLR